MPCHSSGAPASDSSRSRSAHLPVTKRLPLVLFSHMLLLGLAQAVIHIVAPAAKPPAIPSARIVSKRDGGARKRRRLLEDSFYLEEQARHTRTIELPEHFSGHCPPHK